MKTVPVVIYEDGVRRVVGTAVIDIQGEYMDITAKLEVPVSSKDVTCFSLGGK